MFTYFIIFVNSSSEIPQYRLPFEVVTFEVDLVKNLGVKIHTGRALGPNDITIKVNFLKYRLTEIKLVINDPFKLLPLS